MELWLDTADIDSIHQANQLGILHGVTTNPSIFSSAKKDERTLINELLNCQSGLLALQVTQIANATEIVKNARALSEKSPRIVVKIPATDIGIAAMSELKQYKVPVLATAISTTSQFIFATLAGAQYAALYLSHMQKAEKDIYAEIASMLKLVKKHKWQVKLMGAAFADELTAENVMASGIQAVTLTPNVLSELFIIEPLVKLQMQQFEKDWQQYQTS